MARDLVIKSNERVFLCGRTGSGKTYAAKLLLANQARLVLIDSKGDLTDWNTVGWDDDARRALHRGEAVRTRVTAPPVKRVEDFYDDVLAEVYHARDCVVYIDEMLAVARGANPPPYFTAIYTQGRSLGIGAWGSSQRPAWLPRFAVSEAEWFFVFNLLLMDDRQRMAEIIGPEVIERPRNKHGFWLWYQDWNRPDYHPYLISKD